MADHPWTDCAQDAQVRVVMTVIGRDPGPVQKVHVDDEARVPERSTGARFIVPERLLRHHLDTLVLSGEVEAFGRGRYRVPPA